MTEPPIIPFPTSPYCRWPPGLHCADRRSDTVCDGLDVDRDDQEQDHCLLGPGWRRGRPGAVHRHPCRRRRRVHVCGADSGGLPDRQPADRSQPPPWHAGYRGPRQHHHPRHVPPGRQVRRDRGPALPPAGARRPDRRIDRHPRNRDRRRLQPLGPAHPQWATLGVHCRGRPHQHMGAEQQLREGSASAMVITHLLKLRTTEEHFP